VVVLGQEALEGPGDLVVADAAQERDEPPRPQLFLGGAPLAYPQHRSGRHQLQAWQTDETVSHSARPSPVDVMRRYLAAMRGGDREKAYGFYAEDVVFHIPGRSRFAGTHRGRDAAVRYIESAVALVHRGDLEVELVDMLAGEERVALIVRERFGRDDGVVEIRRCNVYRLRDEEIVEIWIFEADQYEVDALLADAAEA
jgi:uncharacterized protein